MPPITIHEDRKTVRRTTATYEQIDDDGNVTQSEIRVEYYSYTTARLRAIVAERQQRLNDGEALWHVDALVDQLHGLPDLVGTKGKPLFIPHNGDEKKRTASLTFLDSLDVQNIEAIKKAIDEDANPKAPPEK